MMWRMAKKNSVEEQNIKHPPGALTLPCTLIQLDEWLKDAHSTGSGAIHQSTVSGTATSLSVA